MNEMKKVYEVGQNGRGKPFILIGSLQYPERCRIQANWQLVRRGGAQ